MKRTNLLLGFVALCFAGAAVFMVSFGDRNQKLYQPRDGRSTNEIGGAMEWLAKIRNNQITGTVDLHDVLMAKKQIAEMPSFKSLNMEWDELGPNNVGGRTRALHVDRNNANRLWAGGVSGGLWKSETRGSSWIQVASFPDMNIGFIAQCPLTGKLYVGTGESFANDGYPYGTPGFVGSGLYESADGGVTWSIFNNAKPTTGNNASIDWAFVNRIAIDHVSGRVFAATNRGLRFWSGTAWVNPIYTTGTNPNTGKCNTVVIGPDRSVIAVVGNRMYLSTGFGDAGTFENVSPSTAAGRTEIAIAPSNPNYVYAVAARTNGSLLNVYRSTDKCATWEIIGPGGSPGFNLFGSNNQGGFDNAVAVHPANPDFILVGGINIWQWYNGGNFVQINSPVEDDPGDFLMRYCHVDIHAFAFDPLDHNSVYIGSDGGIAKGTLGQYGWTYQQLNKNYNVTQFYAVANSKTGMVMGGTQDNSSPFISRTTYDPMEAKILFGGDGGWSAFSAINPEIFFGTMQYGGVWRSPDMGGTYQSATDRDFFSSFMIGNATPGTTQNYAPFVTPLLHWESFANYYSHDSITFTADTAYQIGDVVTVRSSNNNYPFHYVFTEALPEGDSVRVQDIISSRFFVVLSSGIWMTKDALNFSKRPQWIKISDRPSIQTITISNDGNYLFAGTSNGHIHRISNLLSVKDSVTGFILSPYSVVEQKTIQSWSGRAITSIAVDPKNPARVIVTMGNYGNTTYLYYSDNALDENPTFVSKQGSNANNKLPAMPIYSSLIELNDGKRVLVGTEYGIFGTDDITKTAGALVWTKENTGMSPVPVFQIVQQSHIVPGMNNYGVIYIGTHGRGFFESRSYLSVPPSDNKPVAVTKPSMKLYPNPVVHSTQIEYSLPVASKVNVNIYNISGKLVKSVDLSNMPVGKHTASIDCSMLGNGSYIMQLVAGAERTTSKFIIAR